MIEDGPGTLARRARRPRTRPLPTPGDGDGGADPATDCYIEQDAAVALECMLAAGVDTGSSHRRCASLTAALRATLDLQLGYSTTPSSSRPSAAKECFDARSRRWSGLVPAGSPIRRATRCESVRTRRLRRQAAPSTILRPPSPDGPARRGRSASVRSTGTDVTTVFGRREPGALSERRLVVHHWVETAVTNSGIDSDDLVGVLLVEPSR
jgi:hypothetical protein